jgi:hypothetical protein
MEGLELRDIEMDYLRAQTQQVQAVTAEQRYWNTEFTEKYPGVSIPKAQAAFKEEYDKAAKRFGAGPAAHAAATLMFENRCAQMQGHAAKKAPAPAAAPAPAVPTGGGRLTPTAGAAPPAPVNEDPLEEYSRIIAANPAFRANSIK